MHAKAWTPDPARVAVKAAELQESHDLKLDRIMRKTFYKRPGRDTR